MAHYVKIISKEFLTHDVLKIAAEKPAHLKYLPGQATDISINNDKWKKELRPFTFTSLPEEDHIEFTIKVYPSHHGVTEEMLTLDVGDELIVHDPFGDILYKEEGIFIAGGAGVTPFIAIFKELEKEKKVGHNKLIFANKCKTDIILEDKFNNLLGKNFINVLSDEHLDGYENGYISVDLIKKHIEENTKYFYLCGPPPMMTAVEKHLATLGIDENFIRKESY